MPLIFPINPSASQTYQSGSSATYRWNGNFWTTDIAPTATVITSATSSFVQTLRQPVTISGSVNISGSLLINGLPAGAGGGATVTVSGSAPSGSVSSGSLWYNPTGSGLFIQTTAPTGSTYVLLNPPPATITGSAPSGSINSGSLWWNSVEGNLYIQVTSPTGSTWVPATNTVAGGNYGATLVTARTGSTWTINHNLNTLTPIVTVYSGSSVMIPASITSADANNTVITFSGSVQGTAVLSTGVGNQTLALATSASFATTASSAVSASVAVSSSYALRAGRTFESVVIISGSTTNPVKGTSRTVDRIILVDDGSGLCTVTMNYYQSNAGSAGTGDYLFVLPGGYQFDSSFHSAFAVAGDPNLSGNESWIPGSSGKVTSVAASLMASAYAQVWDSTRFRILMGGEMLFGTDARIRTPVGAGFFSLAGTGTGYQMSFTFKKL